MPLTHVSAAIALAAVVVLWLAHVQPPATVARVTIRNPHAWNATVDVSRPGGGAVGLGTAVRGRSARFQEVVDQGDVWVFAFRYGGVDGGSLRVARSELERSRWTVTVPEGFAERMRAARVAPSAR